MSDVIFSEPVDVSNVGSASISRAGTQFSDVTNTFNTAGAQATQPTLAERIQSLFGYQPNPIGNAVQNAADSFVNLFKFGTVSGPVDTSPNEITSPGTDTATKINSNLVIGSAAAVGTTGLIALTATNAGVQQTTQQVAKNLSGPLQTLANAANTTAQTANSIFTGQYGPLLLVGGLALAAVLLLKK